MARLLGAQVHIVGVRPEVAQALVGLGVDCSNFSTYASLQQGIAYLLGRGWSQSGRHQLN
jgi:rsbT co-antagonist protein RsbR